MKEDQKKQLSEQYLNELYKERIIIDKRAINREIRKAVQAGIEMGEKEAEKKLDRIREVNELKYHDFEKRLSNNATIIVNQHNKITELEAAIEELKRI